MTLRHTWLSHKKGPNSQLSSLVWFCSCFGRCLCHLRQINVTQQLAFSSPLSPCDVSAIQTRFPHLATGHVKAVFGCFSPPPTLSLLFLPPFESNIMAPFSLTLFSLRPKSRPTAHCVNTEKGQKEGEWEKKWEAAVVRVSAPLGGTRMLAI